MIVAELHTARLRGGQGLRRALADGVPLEFGNGGQIVDRNEVDLLLQKRGDKRDVPGQAIELGDDKARLVLLAGRGRLHQLGTGAVLARLYFGELVKQRAAVKSRKGGTKHEKQNLVAHSRLNLLSSIHVAAGESYNARQR